MRTTQASAAVERLKTRSGNPMYAMSRRSDELFVLRLTSPDGQSEAVGPPLPMDEFVRFVNGIGPQTPKRVSKVDEAFRSRLHRKPEPQT